MANLSEMRLVLASGSPRRRDLLSSLGFAFDVVATDVEETRLPDEAPATYVERLAREKALAAAAPSTVVLGADTAVVHRGRLMGKPAHPAEAIAMLERLSGEAHTVVTGVAVVRWTEGPSVISAIDRTVVRFLDLTKEEIAAYVATGEPMDKAGAYALQGRGGAFVESVDGSPSNVVGLPVHLAVRLLRVAGFDPFLQLD
jgi:septum formation protein